ncbi:NAD(P)/FAD-dependent oxidoreductase [Halococcoides cellulosivorans]|uniref:Phytoene dehydrogenase n=1 Tax=Halococcoides cellulosivorans TaxID=1679096 RepID=A0A2R4WZ88_9EURY|nr:NAD(P)/FAD-dependent oxidoreductase [Halococcoides cellulosivorans]AWB26848.1 phytoene dehydrogenase [Halococcoides cellulosivorans]
MHVAVVGGGLAGLVAARHLAEDGHSVTVYEDRDSVGGRVRSRTVDGYTLDRGFQVCFPGYPAIERELDAGAIDWRAFPAGATLARPGHRSVLADPLSDPGAAIPTLVNRDVTIGDKLRLLKLRLACRGLGPEEWFVGPDRSIDAILRNRGFSASFRDQFARPFFGGITLDRSLSTDAGVLRAVMATLGGSRAAVPADGMGAIADHLAARVRRTGGSIATGRTVDSYDIDDGVRLSVGGETVYADAAVIATDPPTARALTGVEAIPTAGRGCRTHYFAADRDVDIGQRLVCNAAGGMPNTVAPLSAVAPEYAPEGSTLVSATVVGDDVNGSAQTEALAIEETLADWFPEEPIDAFDHLATDDIPFAQFAQPPGFRADLPAVDAPEGPVVLAGEATRWSSIQGALESGRVAARAIADVAED